MFIGTSFLSLSGTNLSVSLDTESVKQEDRRDYSFTWLHLRPCDRRTYIRHQLSTIMTLCGYTREDIDPRCVVLLVLAAGAALVTLILIILSCVHVM